VYCSDIKALSAKKYVKASKLILYLETKHSNHATKSYRILPTPWSEFETSDYLAGSFPQ